MKILKMEMLKCIVGTHALLNDKINFNKLGLIIYDEEQKLGTQQKEKLKELLQKHMLYLYLLPLYPELYQCLVWH